MKLEKVQILNFRSIEDTEPFELDDLTCLVGKNEAGKTAILQALHAIRPHNAAKTKFDVTEEYPRRFVTRFKERHPDGNAPVVHTWWKLSDEARQAVVGEFGAGALPGGDVEIVKYYDKEETIWALHFDELQALRYLADAHALNTEEKAPHSRSAKPQLRPSTPWRQLKQI